jgi:hypothetical protein
MRCEFQHRIVPAFLSECLHDRLPEHTTSITFLSALWIINSLFVKGNVSCAGNPRRLCNLEYLFLLRGYLMHYSFHIFTSHYYYYYYYYHHHNHILVFTFLHGFYKYVLTWNNHVSSLFSVPAALYLQVVLHVMLFRPRNMLCTFTSALTAVCAHCPVWLFVVFP